MAMNIDGKEFVEVMSKMVNAECKKRGIKCDEDLLHDILLRGWNAYCNLFDDEVGVRWTTYMWRVIDSVLKDFKKARNTVTDLSLSEVEKETMVGTQEETFREKLLCVIAKYYYRVGKDFLDVIMGNIDIKNALISVTRSEKRGEEWIEWWLGRKLTDSEILCCAEVREILRES
jgi:hypothetical protein